MSEPSLFGIARARLIRSLSFILHILAIIGDLAVLIALLYSKEIRDELEGNLDPWIAKGILSLPLIVSIVSAYLR